MYVSNLPAFDAATSAVLFIGLVLAFAVILMHCIGLWLTLQKMGRHDFAALVPVYDTWELSRGAGFSTGLSVLLVVLWMLCACAGVAVPGAVESLAPGTMTTSPGSWYFMADDAVMARSLGPFSGLGPAESEVVLGVSAAIAVAYLGVRIYLCYGVAKSFGHGAGYALGILVLPFLFYLILGASGDKVYRGPVLDRVYRERMRNDWEQLVEGRLAAYGSNAPLALAVLGLVLGGFLHTLPGIVLCIVALARNSREKGKPLSSGKVRATAIVAALGIVVSVAAIAVAVAFTLHVSSLAVL